MSLVLDEIFYELRKFELCDKIKHNKQKPGSFGMITKFENGVYHSDYWTFCREYFLRESDGIKTFLFSHFRGLSYSVASCLREVEIRLNFDQFTKIGPTQRETVVWVEPNSWWMKRAMRRSLLTAILRASQKYTPEESNLEDALFNPEHGTINKYTSETEYAVRRFLEGNTEYTGALMGWYNQFKVGNGDAYAHEPPTEEEIDKLLIKI